IYWVVEMATYPLKASGFSKIFFASKTDRQYSSKLLACSTIASSFSFRSGDLNDPLLLQAVQIVLLEAEDAPVDLLIVEAGGPADPLQPWRGFLRQLGRRAVEDLAVQD